MKKILKIASVILVQVFLSVNLGLSADEARYFQKDTPGALSPKLCLDFSSFQDAYKGFGRISGPRILFDKTNLVIRKNRYTDVDAFRTVIVDNLFNAEFLTSLLENTPDDTLPLPWTVDEIRSFSVYLPSVVNKLQESIGEEKLFELTGVNGMSDKDKILWSIFQVQTELTQRISTMDSFIVGNRGEYKTFLNKIYVYNRITAILVALGLLKKDEADFIPYDFAESQRADVLIDIKKRLLEYLKILPMAIPTPKMRTYEAALLEEEKSRYGYVDWLKEQLKDNLKAVVLYGSAARETKQFNDYDNWIIVEDLNQAYRVLKGKAITYKDGKVLIMGREGKEVSLNIVPADVFAKLFHFNAVCDRNIDHCKVLYGSVNVYEITEQEMLERSISSVYLRLKALRASAMWIGRAPDEIIGKPALFEYFVKNTQFVMNVCINYQEGLRVVSKDEIKRRLKEMGIELFEYKDDPQYIAKAMIQTAVDSSFLHSKYLKDRKPDLSFLNFEAIPLQKRTVMLEAAKAKKQKIKDSFFVALRNSSAAFFIGIKELFFNWWHNDLTKRLNRLRKILGIVIKGENSLRKQFIAYVMIATNLIIDIKFTNIFLKPAVIGLCIISGNPLLMYIAAPVSLFILGGIIRMIPTLIFRVIFFNTVRLNKAGLKALFIPWGIGNFAPLLFLEGSKPEDLFIVNEIRKLSKIIYKTVTNHTSFTEEERNMIEEYYVEMAADIVSHQNCLHGFECRRFKVRGAKAYGKDKIIKNIIRESSGLPLVYQLKRWIYQFFEIVHPGYEKGTRPLLFFGSNEETDGIKYYLDGADVAEEYLENIFWFDSLAYIEERNSQKIKRGAAVVKRGDSKRTGGEALNDEVLEKNEFIPIDAEKFIKPVFKNYASGENNQDFFKPGMTVLDFGSGARLDWGYALTMKYPGIKYIGVDSNDSIKDKFVRWKRYLSLSKADRSRLRFIRQSFFDSLPEDIRQADVITINSPFNTTDFLEQVEKGNLSRVIKRYIKPGGKVFVYTEHFEVSPQKNNSRFINMISFDGARKVFKKSLEKTFGKENVIERLHPPAEYLVQGLIITKLLRLVKEKERKGGKVNEYKASFFIVNIPAESDIQADKEEKIAEYMRYQIQSIKKMGITGQSRVISFNPGWPSAFQKWEKGKADENVPASLEWLAYSAGAEVVIVEVDVLKNKRWQQVAEQIKNKEDSISGISVQREKDLAIKEGDYLIVDGRDNEILGNFRQQGYNFTLLPQEDGFLPQTQRVYRVGKLLKDLFLPGDKPQVLIKEIEQISTSISEILIRQSI
ncbi:MAG: hypothetical protein HY810_01785 [Candidatus Omnitrophica bacterium]|nr:hypothetical protein [Candidatus Omnitrophota bacterium]